MNKKIARHRTFNLSILIFLIASCAFFSIYDIFFEKIWWSTLTIYLPCMLVFSFGVYSWAKMLARNLLILGIIFLVIDAFLVGYGVYLWMQGELLWGPLTLGFSILTIGMTFSIFYANK